jgi:hypothetical protein
MADNTRGGSQDGSNPLIATDEVTHSGDTADVQLIRPVHVTGSEGAKTVVDLTTDDGDIQVTGRNAAIVSDTLSSLNDAITFDVANYAVAYIRFVSGNLNGTVVIEGNDGTEWVYTPGFSASSGIGPYDTLDLVYSGTVFDQTYIVPTQGMAQMRVRVGAYTSGSATVTYRLSTMPSGITAGSVKLYGEDYDSGDPVPIAVHGTSEGVYVSGDIVHDSPDAGNPVKIGGKANTAPPANVADGDRVDASFALNGSQRVALVDSTGAEALVTENNALFVEWDSGLATVIVNGLVAHDLPDSGAPVKVGGYASAAAPVSVGADADRVNAWFLRNGAQATVVTAAGALIGGDATNGLDVDVTRLPALVAGTANIGDVDIASLPDEGQQTMANSISVAIASNQSNVPIAISASSLTIGGVDETGTNAVDALAVGGGTPHDSVDSGNPLKVGFKAANALPTAIANNDRANGISDLWGRQMVTHIDPAQQVWKSYNDTSSRSAGSAQVVWDPTSGKKIAVTHYIISAYGTTAGRIFLFFADDADLTYTAGTDQPLFVGSYAPSTSSKPGTVWTGTVPIFCTTADRRLHYQNDAAISVDVVIYGYEW